MFKKSTQLLTIAFPWWWKLALYCDKLTVLLWYSIELNNVNGNVYIEILKILATFDHRYIYFLHNFMTFFGWKTYKSPYIMPWSSLNKVPTRVFVRLSLFHCPTWKEEALMLSLIYFFINVYEVSLCLKEMLFSIQLTITTLLYNSHAWEVNMRRLSIENSI